jgi:hypothetical protein
LVAEGRLPSPSRARSGGLGARLRRLLGICEGLLLLGKADARAQEGTAPFGEAEVAGDLQRTRTLVHVLVDLSEPLLQELKASHEGEGGPLCDVGRGQDTQHEED